MGFVDRAAFEANREVAVAARHRQKIMRLPHPPAVVGRRVCTVSGTPCHIAALDDDTHYVHVAHAGALHRMPLTQLYDLEA